MQTEEWWEAGESIACKILEIIFPSDRQIQTLPAIVGVVLLLVFCQSAAHTGSFGFPVGGGGRLPRRLAVCVALPRSGPAITHVITTEAEPGLAG